MTPTLKDKIAAYAHLTLSGLACLGFAGVVCSICNLF